MPTELPIWHHGLLCAALLLVCSLKHPVMSRVVLQNVAITVEVVNSDNPSTDVHQSALNFEIADFEFCAMTKNVLYSLYPLASGQDSTEKLESCVPKTVLHFRQFPMEATPCWHCFVTIRLLFIVPQVHLKQFVHFPLNKVKHSHKNTNVEFSASTSSDSRNHWDKRHKSTLHTSSPRMRRTSGVKLSNGKLLRDLGHSLSCSWVILHRSLTHKCSTTQTFVWYQFHRPIMWKR